MSERAQARRNSDRNWSLLNYSPTQAGAAIRIRGDGDPVAGFRIVELRWDQARGRWRRCRSRPRRERHPPDRLKARAGSASTCRPAFNSCPAQAPSAAVDLKHPDGLKLAADLVAGRLMLLIEGFRPGTMENLGLGPDAVPRAQPASPLLRAHDRMGQSAALPGRPDMTSTISPLTGALAAIIGRFGSKPTPPLNSRRGFRRRGVSLSRLRHGVRHGGGAAIRQAGPSGRRGDGKARRR